MHKNKVLNVLDTGFFTTNDLILSPQLGVLSSRSEAEIKPYIYTSPMDTVTGYKMTEAIVEEGEYAVVCRFLSQEWKDCLRDFYKHKNVFFAIGASQTNYDELISLLQELSGIVDDYVPVSICLDIAHGDSQMAHQITAKLSQSPLVGRIMSGCISNPNGAVRAIEAGCSDIRVGIGPGSVCTTRLMTGCGMPQLSAVYLVHLAILDAMGPERRKRFKVIADGGIKHPGDAVKLLAAGADGIMMGSVFSSVYESPGWIDLNDIHHIKNQINKPVSFPLQRPQPSYVKKYRGQASASFQQDMFGTSNNCPEGATTDYIKPTSPVKEVLDLYRGGLRSAISYLGLKSIDDLEPDNVVFIPLTQASYIEGTPHGTT